MVANPGKSPSQLETKTYRKKVKTNGKNILPLLPAISSQIPNPPSTTISPKFWIPDGTSFILLVTKILNVAKIPMTIQLTKRVLVIGRFPKKPKTSGFKTIACSIRLYCKLSQPQIQREAIRICYPPPAPPGGATTSPSSELLSVGAECGVETFKSPKLSQTDFT